MVRISEVADDFFPENPSDFSRLFFNLRLDTIEKQGIMSLCSWNSVGYKNRWISLIALRYSMEGN